MVIKEKFIPGIARPRSCLHEKFQQQSNGSWKAVCDPLVKQQCFGCPGEVTLDFNPTRIINYKEIRAQNEEDYEMGPFAIVTTAEYDKRALKQYTDSPEQWYYFHDFICDEDRIGIFQIK